jgi:hypothetical protein
MVPARRMRMVRSFFVGSSVVMRGCLPVMVGRLLMMVGRLAMVIRSLFRHL